MSRHTVEDLGWEEWNAAYFLGLEDIFLRGCRCNVQQQVERGMDLLAQTGYRSPSTPGVSHVASPHEQACREIAEGTFAAVDRARSAIAWLNDRAPQLRSTWLQALVRTYDALHSELPERDVSRW